MAVRVHDSRKSKKSRRAPAREQLFVIISDAYADDSDNPLEVADITHLVGSELTNYRRPIGMIATRITPDVIAVAFNQFSKEQAKRAVKEKVAVPGGKLTRLERRSAEVRGQLDSTHVLFEVRTRDDEDNFVNRTWVMGLEVTDGKASLDLAEDDQIELPRGPLSASMYLTVEIGGRTRCVAASFQGYLNQKPGSVESVERVASLVLVALTHVPHIKALAGITAVDLPAGTGGRTAPVQLKSDLSAPVQVPVAIFADQSTHLGTGQVEVRIDLTTAVDTFTYAISASGDLAEHWTPAFERQLRLYLEETLRNALGYDLYRQILVEIMLGDLGEASREALATALNTPLRDGATFVALMPERYGVA